MTFSKRRSALFKRARQLAVLCDAQMAVIIFSRSGKMFHFASPNSNIKMILERYADANKEKTTTSGSSGFHINNNHGDEDITSTKNIGSLDCRMLNELEQQLSMHLCFVREKKNQKMMEEMQDLHLKERKLLEDNKTLTHMIAELQSSNSGAGEEEVMST